MKTNQIFLIGLAAIVLVGIFYISPLGNLFKPNDTNNNLENHTNILLTEDDFNLNLLAINNSSDVNLNSLKGKVIFINFWGIWCPPCRQEMPTIQSLHDKYKNEVNFVMIAVPARGEELKSDVSKFLTENNYNFPTYEINAVPSIKFQSNVVPFTFIINKKGEIVYRFEGSRDWDDKEINELIKKLVEEKN